MIYYLSPYIYKDNNWYPLETKCITCGELIIRSYRIQRINTNKYKKGELVFEYYHKDSLHSKLCKYMKIKMKTKNRRRTIEQKNRMSLARKGKFPWNKNKKYPDIPYNISDIDENIYPETKRCEHCYQLLYRKVRINKTGSKTTKKGQMIITYVHENEEAFKLCKSIKKSKSVMGRIPWNKGIKLTEEERLQKSKRETETRKKNGSTRVSIIEKHITKLLSNYFKVKTQYYIKNYSGVFDQYLIDFNILCETQGNYWHQDHPYDPNDIKDRVLLKELKEKSKCSDIDKKRLYTWTIKDPEKRNVCKINNIRLVEFFKIEDVYDLIKELTGLTFLPMIV